MSVCNGSRNGDSRLRSQAGGAAATALLLLLVVSAALGWNYYRNYQIDRSTEMVERPFSNYATQDLAIMAEGYRVALAEAKTKQVGGRVGTKERYFFGEQIKEFERVQRETRQVRDRAIDVKEVQDKLVLVEAEQQRRSQRGWIAMVHLKRLFRI